MSSPLMGRDFFQILPSKLTSNILSRLPFRSAAISKCVCKSWLSLLDSDYFEIKTPPALVCLNSLMKPSRCAIFEIEDKDEACWESHDLHYVPLTDFDIPFGISAMKCTAANGLLLLYSHIRRDPEIMFTYAILSLVNISSSSLLRNSSQAYSLICILVLM